MSGHEKHICSKCNKVIFQCRCIDHEKNITYGICDDCRMPEKPMINEDKDLKPCPFCGCQPRMPVNEWQKGSVYCGCISNDGLVRIETWNTRATPQQPSEYMYFAELCEVLGWKGGTIRQVLDEVKRLKGIEQQPSEPLKELDYDSVLKYLKENNGIGGIGYAHVHQFYEPHLVYFAQQFKLWITVNH